MRYEKGSFAVVPNINILSGMHPIAQAIYLRLCVRADGQGECYPSISTIAEEAGTCHKTIKIHLKSLVDAGVLEIVYRKESDGTSKSNVYRLLIGNEIPGRGYVVPRGGGTTYPREGVPHTPELYPVLTKPSRTISSTPGTSCGAKQTEPSEINLAIGYFSGLNEATGNLFKNRTQRSSMAALLSRHSLDEIKAMVEFCIANVGDRFLPQVSTPIELEAKWSKLEAYKKKQTTVASSPNTYHTTNPSKYDNIKVINEKGEWVLASSIK